MPAPGRVTPTDTTSSDSILVCLASVAFASMVVCSTGLDLGDDFVTREDGPTTFFFFLLLKRLGVARPLLF